MRRPFRSGELCVVDGGSDGLQNEAPAAGLIA